MKISLEIPDQRIADLFTTAIESGDPVTTAARGGWCNGIDIVGKYTGPGPWYTDPAVFAAHHRIEIIEVIDEATGKEKKHRVSYRHFVKGLEKMASLFPDAFGQVMRDDIDAPCADLFLQAMLFGEEKYA